ncbi:hypothetical protein [Gilvibacter sp. SZ-19]|uniref:hypothetical protein n=1 Tax=unclassified Gilvibacter TaxID=2625242 RepID=UPI000B3D2655|nr:hypothetical protein [Gilvibacter sp. SZ-19]ARV11711.1 hypothetical protein BTO09_04850 [Gilvibacter sp. SZ-19]
MERACLECGAVLVGRSDKKFCDDGCRNNHNNRINRANTKTIRNTNNSLMRNWRILNSLNPKQKSKTSRSKLQELGFNFNLYTRIYTTKAGRVYYFVYDQGYLPLENDYFALVKRQ